MRKIIIALLLSAASLTLAQNPEIKTDLPTIIPPSPTVAALMKFEEVPVSNYTGVPDISIPLFSIPTHSKDLGLNVSLKYHSGVSSNDIASDTGLGWSLFAGGTISRTVRGLPDEELILDGGGQSHSGKVGLYHTSYNLHANKYYHINENFFDEDENSLYDNVGLPQSEKDSINDFIWSSSEVGRYDTEHDLWQFNFMGNSGRFFIKKNITTNLLEVVPLDDYRVKIEYNHVTVGINNYIPNEFIIYDEKGFKYVFNVTEKNKTFSAIENHNYGAVFSQFTTTEKEHISAIHLSQVFDQNGKLLISFEYTTDNQIKECTRDYSETRNEPYGNNSGQFLLLAPNYSCMNEFPPLRSSVNSFNLTTVRKLVTINIADYGYLNFDYGMGRQDTDIGLQGTAPYLESITLENISHNSIKSFQFEYDYSTVLTKRMILKSITENQTLKHEFFYNQNDSSGYIVGKDYWGYLNLISACRIVTTFDKEVTPNFASTDLLQKIKYPTGGSVIFDFESNTYSHVGSVGLTNFDDNPNNFSDHTVPLTFNNLVNSNNTNNTNNDAPLQLLEYSATENVKVKIQSGLSYPEDIANATKSFKLMKLVNGVWQQDSNLTCPYNSDNCCYDLVLESGFQYGIKRELLVSNYSGPSDQISVTYFNRNSNNFEFVYGGGNRIKQIGYFDKETPQDYFESNSTQQPEKLKIYNYNYFDNSKKSSGSLVYSKPIYTFDTDFSIHTCCALLTGTINTQFNYKSHSNKNFLIPIKTQGSDVGYKYVTVSEINNGKIQFEYSSPIDVPEVISSFIKPHIRAKNLDYKRGLLKSEKIYDNNRLLKEIVYDYTYSNYEEQTGLKVFRYNSDAFFKGSFFDNYWDLKFMYDMNQNIIGTDNSNPNIPAWYVKSPISFHCGNPLNQRNFYIRPIIEAYGWAKLTSKTNKDYFYDSNNNQRIVETNETYTYNPINKQISESTVTNSNQGEVLKTKYFYHTGNSSYSQNRIAEIEKIETYRGSELLSTSQINYANNWSGNASYLPQSIVTSKGNASLENRLIYELYDEFGNPLQLKQESGTVVTYIWGYNKTQPIAKIENATYAQVSSYVSNLQTLSNGTDEANLIIALNALQTALPNAMITTLTYIPLVGVHTITDPKGDIQTYEYDTFGRLKAVYDKDGYKLAENDYHYRTQN